MTPVEQAPSMTEAEWNALGEKLFGADRALWRFVCPACGNIASLQAARELPDEQLAKLRAARWRPEQECIGRHARDVKNCDWCAYGLFCGPFFVVRPGGGRTPVFGFDVSGGAR